MAASDDNFDQFDDELPEGSEVQGGDRRKRLFSKELRCMMYGFGDDQNPYTESVDLLEDLVIEFIIEMVSGGMLRRPPIKQPVSALMGFVLLPDGGRPNGNKITGQRQN
ncbi:unnamed protein product [Ixodes pacificus]